MTSQRAIRAATQADFEGIAAVLAANDEPLARREPVGYPYLQHLLARGRLPVAVDVSGRVIGFAGAVRVGQGTMLTDLWIDPPSHGRGIGSALLEVALGDDEPRMTFSSADPRALPVYVRAGLRPWWPNLYLRARPDALARLPSASSVRAERASVEATAAAATALSGIDRSADFAFYAREPGAEGWLIRDGDSIAAVVWATDEEHDEGRTIAHATLARDADPIPTVAAAFRVAAAGAASVWGCVPGPNGALATLLAAGLRIEDRDTFCTSEPGWLDPTSILPNPGLL